MLRSLSVTSVGTGAGKQLADGTNATAQTPVIVLASCTAAWLAGGPNENPALPVAANAVQQFTLYPGDVLYGAAASATVTITVLARAHS